MLVDVINHEAAQALLYLVKQNSNVSGGWGALHFAKMRLAAFPTEEDILAVIQPLAEEQKLCVYMLEGGNFIVTWHGAQKAMLEVLCSRLYAKFAPGKSDGLHTYFNIQTDSKGLIELLEESTEGALVIPPLEEGSYKPAFSSSQLRNIRRYSAERKSYRTPSVLIVEDQGFSRKLLESMMGRHYVHYSAGTAQQAVALYGEHVPCITFLDVELPDLSGHLLAEFLKKHDPAGYIIMVTANHSEIDVERARRNNVQGFVVKPYSKQRIMEIIKKYQQD